MHRASKNLSNAVVPSPNVRLVRPGYVEITSSSYNEMCGASAFDMTHYKNYHENTVAQLSVIVTFRTVESVFHSSPSGGYADPDCLIVTIANSPTPLPFCFNSKERAQSAYAKLKELLSEMP